MDFKRLDDVSGVGAERFGGIARGSWGSNALAVVKLGSTSSSEEARVEFDKKKSQKKSDLPTTVSAVAMASGRRMDTAARGTR